MWGHTPSLCPKRGLKIDDWTSDAAEAQDMVDRIISFWSERIRKVGLPVLEVIRDYGDEKEDLPRRASESRCIDSDLRGAFR